MTSLPFFPPIAPKQELYPDWGTGKKNKTEVPHTGQLATFNLANVPVRQFYDLTQLKRSNVRSNDELAPRPTDVDMAPYVIERPFPAEHPYASHEPRLALFPKFTECPDDPRTGVRAQINQPKHVEIPSKAPDLRIISKTKGSGMHHVVQQVPLESEKAPLSWPGDRYEQIVKGEHRAKQTFYPTPPKLVQPNMEPRMAGRSVSELTADTLKNLERQQWLTHYTKQYTGLGPADPAQLTNLAEKQLQAVREGVCDDDLKPRNTRSFDPPRPVEGRISRQIHPRPAMPPPPVPNANRKPTLTEVEEDRLLNGKTYASLPENAFNQMVQDQQWRILELGKTPEQNLERLAAVRASAPAQLPTEQRPADSNPVAQRQVTFKDQVQQMEAEDRWRVLENEGAAQDMSQLRHKYLAMNQPSKESARVFYNHEGRFQEERSGLYRTSYDPQLLRHAMPGGQDANAGRLFDTSQSHEGAYLAPSPLNRAISLPNLGRSGNDLMMHQLQKDNQRAMLEPTAAGASVRVQEGGHLIQRESEQGANYNIDKFLQEHELPKYARNDPQRTFGRNGDLGTVQPQCARLSSPGRVTFSNDVMVATGYGNEPIRLSSAALNDSDDGYHSGSAGEADGEAARRFQGTGGRRMLLPEEARMVAHQQASRASSFQGAAPQEFATTFRSQFPAGLPLGFKDNDPRFHWEPGKGSRWPQSRLLDLQHSFDMTEVRRRFHTQFHEQNADLRENVILGKKHEFSGINSQVIRG